MIYEFSNIVLVCFFCFLIRRVFCRGGFGSFVLVFFLLFGLSRSVFLGCNFVVFLFLVLFF